METAFFIERAGQFHPTEVTRGPWHPGWMHGGPVAGLLARGAAQALGPDSPFQIAKLGIEFLRPLEMVPLTLRVDGLKAGSTVARCVVNLENASGVMAKANVVAIKRQNPGLPAAVHRTPELPSADALPPYTFSFFTTDVGYHRAVELRFARGTWGDNEVWAWMRTRVELVEGTPTSALERVGMLADAESGVCPPLDPNRYTFVNPDLTIVVERMPSESWLLFHCTSTSSGAIGIAQSRLYDSQGAFGRAAQTMVMGARP